ncbi:MAG: N-formylglutamate amidohydrolase [Myxococcales bacterium]|nr:N-formylglutamate amidohydrolase [Myxococcales bacterium]
MKWMTTTCAPGKVRAVNALPFLFIPPDVSPTPLIVVVPHAGVRMSRAEQARCPVPDPVRLSDTDLQAERLVDRAPLLGASLLVVTSSRYVCDVDQATDTLDPRVCPELGTRTLGGAPQAARPGSLPRGLIWRETTRGVPCLDGTLSLTDVRERVSRIHGAFHDKLTAVIASTIAKSGRALVFDLRTVPGVGRPTDVDAGRGRAAAAIGGTQASASAVATTKQVLGGHGIDLGRGVTPDGAIATTVAAAGADYLRLELSRRLYLHEEVPFWNGAPALELQRVCRELISALSR